MPETVRETADKFFNAMRPQADAFVKTAKEFVDSIPADDPIARYAASLFYEFDLKVREAMHRVNDLCGASLQSKRAANERV